MPKKLVLAFLVEEPDDFTARAEFYRKLGPQYDGFKTFIVDEMHGEALEAKEPKQASDTPRKRGNTVGWRQRKAEREAAKSKGDGTGHVIHQYTPPPDTAA